MATSFLNPYQNAQWMPEITKKRGLTGALADTQHRTALGMGGAYDQRNRSASTLFPQYESMAQGGSAEDNNALEQSVLTPLRGAFDTARSKAGNRVARTRNSAGYGSFLSEIGREEGRQSSQAGFDIANEKFRRKQAGLEGLAQMYGIDTSFLNALGQQQLASLGMSSGVESRRRSTLDTIGQTFDLAHKIGGSVVGGMFPGAG